MKSQATPGLGILLQAHGSTGVKVAQGWSRDEQDPTGPMYLQRTEGERTEETKSGERLAAESPVGSEVVFHNLALDTPETFSHSYRFENAIKIGQGQYLAYPFGPVGEDSLRDRMAAIQHAGRQNIVIQAVVRFGFPQ